MVVALLATAGVVADVETGLGAEDMLDVETVLLLEGAAVDEALSSELLLSLESLLPLEAVLPELSSLVDTAFETQLFDNNGAFVRSATVPAQKAWIECSGVPSRQFFKQHIPASLGLISLQSSAPKLTPSGLGVRFLATRCMFCAKGQSPQAGLERVLVNTLSAETYVVSPSLLSLNLGTPFWLAHSMKTEAPYFWTKHSG